jgi:cysteine synthase
MLADLVEEPLKKGKDILQGHVDDLAREASERGELLLEEAKKQGIALLAIAAQHGLQLLEEWKGVASEVAPRAARRRSRRTGWTVGLLAGAAVAGALLWLAIED